MMKIDGVTVLVDGFDDMSEEEIKKYITIAKKDAGRDDIEHIIIGDAGGGKVSLDYVCAYRPFERIRRITGYLVGSIDRWNNAKRAEERDRVKHGITQ